MGTYVLRVANKLQKFGEKYCNEMVINKTFFIYSSTFIDHLPRLHTMYQKIEKQSHANNTNNTKVKLSLE